MENQEFIVDDSQIVANLSGNLQGDIAAQVREAMLTYIEDGYNSFTVDFSKVTSIDSTGLGILVTIQKRSLQNGGIIILRGLHGAVKAAFDRTRLSKAFPIADSETAVA
jgi:anti-sigma B factor antagonist